MSSSTISGPFTVTTGPVTSTTIVGSTSVTGAAIVGSTSVTGAIVNASTTLQIAGVAVGSTAAEINARSDDSAMVETVTGAGAISPTIAETRLVTTGANALTLAVPTKPGFTKIITMKTDGGDGTLASTNIIGQSSGTTSITFDNAGDTLILFSNVDLGKWEVIKERGVTAA